MVPAPVGSTHLRFGDARVVMGNSMWLPKVVRSPGCDPGRYEEFRNGSAVKIDILDEGYWSPKVFRGYQAMASMTERCFGRPDKCWRASSAKGEGANQPTKGWCTPTPFTTLFGEVGRLHLAWGAILHLLGLGGKSP